MQCFGSAIAVFQIVYFCFFLVAEAVVGKPHIDSERQSSSTVEADENGLLHCIVSLAFFFIIEVREKCGVLSSSPLFQYSLKHWSNIKLLTMELFCFSETLGNISRDAVRKLLKKAKTRGGYRGSDTDDAYLRRCDSTGKVCFFHTFSLPVLAYVCLAGLVILMLGFTT